MEEKTERLNETKIHKILRLSSKYMPILYVVLIIIALFLAIGEESLFTLGETGTIVCWTLFGIVMFLGLVELTFFIILRKMDSEKKLESEPKEEENEQ